MGDWNFLVVEDSPTMRQLIGFGLKRIRNAKVREAGNGIEAIKILSEEKIDLVVADINMPLMDGLKLLTLIRKDVRISSLPVIIVSTEGTQTDQQRGLSLGANAYLPKPVQVNELLKTVKEILKISE